MPDAAIFQIMDKFSGINNVEPATRLMPAFINKVPIYPLQLAVNVDIDNTYQLASRPNYTSILSGNDIHSLWSDGVVCLFADGETLKLLNTDYTTTILRSGLQLNSRISYTSFNDRIYYTNGHQIGYIKNQTDYPVPDPLLDFKLPLPPGQLIEVFMGCLYVAVDNVLYISDPLCDYFDVRTGYKLFNASISLLRAVDDGIYVSDNSIWFLHGKASEDFNRLLSSSSRAIPFTDVRIPGQDAGDELYGNIAIWTAEDGICIGENNGNVTNLTVTRYTFTPHSTGTGFVRDKSNVKHYINSLY